MQCACELRVSKLGSKFGLWIETVLAMLMLGCIQNDFFDFCKTMHQYYS